MIVQIYSLTAAEDVRALVELGIEHVGFVVDEPGLPANNTVEEARTLFDIVPEDTTTVSLTVRRDVEEILSKVETLPPDILHLCPEPGAISVAEQREIRNGLPPEVEVMKAIEVAGPDAIETARRFAPVTDYFILDTATPDIEGVGASGETHDWSISSEVVEAVDVPVILAGGLGPENVAEAVRTVEPAGVDSYSRTSRTADRKDIDRVETFARRARAAARNNG